VNCILQPDEVTTYVYYLLSLKSVLISSRTRLGLQKWSLPFRFSDPILYAVLLSRALHVSTPLSFLNFVAPVTFFEGWNVYISSLHSFPLLRIWLWNVMQTSRKLCCVVRLFKSYGNCLAVHLRRFMSNRVLSEQLGV